MFIRDKNRTLVTTPSERREKMKKKLSASFTAAVTAICCSINAHALSISPNAKPSDFDSYTIGDFMGDVLGTVFFILRLFGLLALTWGLYNAITVSYTHYTSPPIYLV